MVICSHVYSIEREHISIVCKDKNSWAIKWYLYILYIYIFSSLPSGSVVKNPPTDAGDVGSVLGLGRSPGEGNGSPLQNPCWRIPWTEEPGVHSPQGCTESDVTAHTCVVVFFSSVRLFMGQRMCVCLYCVFLSVCKILGLNFSIWPACFRSLFLFIYPSVIDKMSFSMLKM